MRRRKTAQVPNNSPVYTTLNAEFTQVFMRHAIRIVFFTTASRTRQTKGDLNATYFDSHLNLNSTHSCCYRCTRRNYIRCTSKRWHMTILIHQYYGPSITVTFIGDYKPNGYVDYRIVDAFTKAILKGNTGWTRI